MRVRYLPSALRQLDAILDYIDAHDLQGANRVKARINAMTMLLSTHPLTGETTRRPGQRRMLVSPFPYVIFYRVTDDEVIVQRVRHTSRRPL